jgi:hypothetical protein
MLIVTIIGMFQIPFDSDTLPGSLVDSIESLKWKQRKSKESRHIPWLVALWG